MKYLFGLFVFSFLAAAFAGTTCVTGYGWSGTPFICTTTPAEANDNNMPNFPWEASGWHKYERSKAYNIAFNKAVAECQEWDLVLDRQSIDVEYGYVTIQGGHHTAHLLYYCETPPPRYWKQSLSYTIEGAFNCNPGVALDRAEDAGYAACAARGSGWFMGDYTIMGVSQIGSGECGFGSWGPNPSYSYRILPECWKQQ